MIGYGLTCTSGAVFSATRIRYTAMSLPYHIGNGWLGGFLPTTAFAMVAATGDHGSLLSHRDCWDLLHRVYLVRARDKKTVLSSESANNRRVTKWCLLSVACTPILGPLLTFRILKLLATENDRSLTDLGHSH